MERPLRAPWTRRLFRTPQVCPPSRLLKKPAPAAPTYMGGGPSGPLAGSRATRQMFLGSVEAPTECQVLPSSVRSNPLPMVAAKAVVGAAGALTTLNDAGVGGRWLS